MLGSFVQSCVLDAQLKYRASFKKKHMGKWWWGICGVSWTKGSSQGLKPDSPSLFLSVGGDSMPSPLGHLQEMHHL